MRYAQGGGLTAERRAFREQVRLDAGEMFAAGSDNAEGAKVLRVHVRSVQRWRREWAERGEAGLVSTGPAGLPKLSASPTIPTTGPTARATSSTFSSGS